MNTGARLLPLLAALATACAGPHGVRDWTGSQSEMPAVQHLVAQDAADWAKVWERVDPARKPPKADLEKHFAVAVFLGDKGPGEYRFAWTHHSNDKRTLIGYKVYRVGDTGPRTRPYAVFLFPRSFTRPGAEILVEDQTPGGAGLQ